MATKFRKKPIVIEAWQHLKHPTFQPLWVFENSSYDAPNKTLRITTPEGVLVANIGDWIIRGIKGEVYPCPLDVFEATYEAVE